MMPSDRASAALDGVMITYCLIGHAFFLLVVVSGFMDLWACN